MLFYLAPMEGITGYIVRNAYAHYFPYIDKYFTPFIPAAKKMSKKIKRDLAAENNEQIRLVPQLIGNRGDEFLMMIRQLEDLGFTSVNLNFFFGGSNSRRKFIILFRLLVIINKMLCR